jgi:hypothetical protein
MDTEERKLRERERERERYAHLTQEQREHRQALNRESKRARDNARYARLTAEEKRTRYTQISKAELERKLHFIGNGIPELPNPVMTRCPCCGNDLGDNPYGEFCDFTCARNYEVAPKRPLPSPFMNKTIHKIRH